MFIGPNKKLINLINDMNQDLKAIYKEYTIHHNGRYISSPKQDYVMKTGEHYCVATINGLGEHLGGLGAVIDSANVYRVVKENKKALWGVLCENGDIHLCGAHGELIDGADTSIGKYLIIDIGNIAKYTEYKSTHDTIMNLAATYEPMYTLTDDEVLSLTKNRPLWVGEKPNHTRITKELLPGLKKTHMVDYSVKSVSADRFTITFRVTRETVTSYHIYQCVPI